jgi:hypothetical protein
MYGNKTKRIIAYLRIFKIYFKCVNLTIHCGFLLLLSRFIKISVLFRAPLITFYLTNTNTLQTMTIQVLWGVSSLLIVHIYLNTYHWTLRNIAEYLRLHPLHCNRLISSNTVQFSQISSITESICII